MSTQELRLRYLIQLASNVGVVARKEAEEFGRQQERMRVSVRDTDRSVRDLDRSLEQLASNTSTERQIRYMDRLAQSVERTHQRMKQLKTEMLEGAKNLPELAAGGAAAYFGGRTLVAPPMRAFSDLEDATLQLKATMLNAKLQVDKAFPAIAKKAEELGNKLPGTTRDFYQSANELIRQGVPADVVANGGLEAASKFGVLMRMDQGRSATTIAKVREAYALAPNELPQMADLMQRASAAAGIDPGDFLDVARYAAPTYNTMHLTGLANAKKLLAVQGIAAGVGLESTSFGTNFAQMLSRLSQVDQRVARNSPESRQVKALLDSHKVDLQFFDKGGEFMGVENMLAQLAKLRGLSTIDKQHISKVMFGDEAGRPAQILIDKGMEAYREQLNRMDSQANLDQKLDVVLSGLKSKLEGLAGTIETVMARLATSTGNAAKPVVDFLNDAIAPAGDALLNNPLPSAALLGGIGTAGAAGALRGYGALRSAFGWGGGAAPASVAQVAAHNPFRGLGVSMAPVAAQPSIWARMGAYGKWAGPALSAASFGLESYDVLTNDDLSGWGKARGVSMAAAGAGGAWLGAKAGMALGSAVMPGMGTVAGGLIGGGLGYFAGKYGLGGMWGADPARDYVKLTAPNGAALGAMAAGGGATIQLGEGVVRLDVRVTPEGGVFTQTTVDKPMALLRVEAGSTDPGSFASMSGGRR